MIIRSHHTDGRPKRVTVAVWKELRGDGESTDWRLDRVVADPGRRRHPVFELVDKRCPSSTLLTPLWIEYAIQGDPSRAMGPGDWFLTEEWERIEDKREQHGCPPVQLRERMLGILSILFPGRTSRDLPLSTRWNRPTIDAGKPRWLFVNRYGSDSWFFLPHRLDARLVEGADRLDEALKQPEQIRGSLTENQRTGILERTLGRPVGTTPGTAIVIFDVETSAGSGDRLAFHWSQAFVPAFTAYPADRTVEAHSFLAMLQKLESGGFVVREEDWDRWFSENSLPPKLLLEPELVRMYGALGETLPLLWPDDEFSTWVVEQQNEGIEGSSSG